MNPTTTDAAIEVLAQIVAAIHPKAGHTVEARGNMFDEGCAALSVLRNTETPATAHGGTQAALNAEYTRGRNDGWEAAQAKYSSPPAGGFVVDLSRVLALSEEGASWGPMQWLAKPDMTPDEMKAWIAESVDITVSDEAFTGTLHSIAEQDTGRIIAYTGCGPKSGPNAQFLIAAAHFIIQHGPSLAPPTAQPSAKDGVRGES